MALGCFHTVGGSWNKNFHPQPLQPCHYENSGNSGRAGILRPHYSMTYTQLVHARTGLLAVGRVGNLICGRSSYVKMTKSSETAMTASYEITCSLTNHSESINEGTIVKESMIKAPENL